MPDSGRRPLALIAVLLGIAPAGLIDPVRAGGGGPGATAERMPAYRSTGCASASCEEDWRLRLLLEEIFDDGFEVGGACSVLWTDWIGACGPNEECSGGACACSFGYNDCNGLEDGCECATPSCCAGSCAPQHANGLGQSYYDCAPLGVPGDAGTYSGALATAARAAWLPGIDSSGTCGATQVLSRIGAGVCAVWAYTTSLAGRVRLAATCDCPDAADPTWN